MTENMASQARPSPTIPPGRIAITVRLINPVDFGPAILDRFMAPKVPGLETFESCPSLCFLLEHPSGRKLVWDLGIRDDYENYAPKIASYIPTTKYNIKLNGDVASRLRAGGYRLEDIEVVIWSHWHWDHIGNPATFPQSTGLVVGAGFKQAMLPGAPLNPDSPLLQSDFEDRELKEIEFSGPDCWTIGQFSAMDYFGDGSFYLLDSPGHAVGHLCGLARTTTNPDTFILLGGDVCHYAGILRPSSYLPLPKEIRPHPLHPGVNVGFCPGHAFEDLQKSRGRSSNDTLYDPTFGHDIPLAIGTIKKLQELDCDDNVFVIIAHDRYVRDTVDHFPLSLNDWKAKGWGQQTRWAFLRDLETYWKSRGLVEGE